VPLTAGNIAYYTLQHAQSIKEFMGEDVLAFGLWGELGVDGGW